jgi:hypothetical protein
VAPTGTNEGICTEVKIPGTNEKSGQGQTPDSLVVLIMIKHPFISCTVSFAHRTLFSESGTLHKQQARAYYG